MCVTLGERGVHSRSFPRIKSAAHSHIFLPRLGPCVLGASPIHMYITGAVKRRYLILLSIYLAPLFSQNVTFTAQVHSRKCPGHPNERWVTTLSPRGTSLPMPLYLPDGRCVNATILPAWWNRSVGPCKLIPSVSVIMGGLNCRRANHRPFQWVCEYRYQVAVGSTRGRVSYRYSAVVIVRKRPRKSRQRSRWVYVCSAPPR